MHAEASSTFPDQYCTSQAGHVNVRTIPPHAADLPTPHRACPPLRLPRGSSQQFFSYRDCLPHHVRRLSSLTSGLTPSIAWFLHHVMSLTRDPQKERQIRAKCKPWIHQQMSRRKFLESATCALRHHEGGTQSDGT